VMAMMPAVMILRMFFMAVAPVCLRRAPCSI
jgi:hypothetical protein